MQRYKNTELSNYTKNKKSFDTTIYKEVPKKDTDEYFIAQEGDRCDNLANQFYGDSTLWWFIARVNDLQTMNIPAGTSLRIPISIENAKGF
tara:strand:+ start:41 stop:313 length:273 start_codon:yes stop_codon:yes gene_type:complete